MTQCCISFPSLQPYLFPLPYFALPYLVIAEFLEFLPHDSPDQPPSIKASSMADFYTTSLDPATIVGITFGIVTVLLMVHEKRTSWCRKKISALQAYISVKFGGKVRIRPKLPYTP